LRNKVDLSVKKDFDASVKREFDARREDAGFFEASAKRVFASKSKLNKVQKEELHWA